MRTLKSLEIKLHLAIAQVRLLLSGWGLCMIRERLKTDENDLF